MYSRIIYNNKNWLQSSIIVAGWDSKFGPQVYAVSSGGSLVPVEGYYGTGSGMAILRGYLEAHYRPNMSYEEARQLLINSKNIDKDRHFSFHQERHILRRQHQTVEGMQGGTG